LTTRTLAQQRAQAAASGATAGGTDTPERIVLYIDDLDRCPPRRVVEVLAAVHLMLALDLFIVIVAVDNRWLKRSLKRHHRDLFGLIASDRDDLGTTPLDFLDKIFQIPYGLRPMTTAGGRALLTALLPAEDATIAELPATSPPATPAPPPPASEPPVPSQPSQPSPTTSMPPAATPTAPAFLTTTTGRQVLNAAATASPPVRELASGLHITRAERDFIPLLSPILPTPRSLKKLVNIYRLVRLAVTDTDRAQYLAGPYQAAALLLAILIGRPDHATAAFTAVLNATAGSDVIDILRRAAPASDPDWHPVRRVLDDLTAATTLTPDLPSYQRYCRELARYSFYTQELWKAAHTLS
jgi:hypothetical protein